MDLATMISDVGHSVQAEMTQGDIRQDNWEMTAKEAAKEAAKA
jgi:hypothetical protein